jgi:hypothetical protein
MVQPLRAGRIALDGVEVEAPTDPDNEPEPDGPMDMYGRSQA